MFKTTQNNLLILLAGLGCLLMLSSVNAIADDKGKATYDKSCAMCHKGGMMGAHKFGDKADWGGRLAQGKDVLYKHAIEGFKGKKGAMPPKGGNTKLSDQDVKAAVDYLLATAK